MSTATEFTTMARRLMDVTRQLGLEVPALRSPYPGQRERRVLRRFAEGTVVAVQVAGRDAHDVASDLIDGIVAANRLDDPVHVETVRHALWSALDVAAVA